MSHHGDADAAATGRPSDVPEREPGLRIAFIVRVFPVVSETFIIDQIAQIEDRGVSVDVFADFRGDTANVSEKFFRYRMAHRVKYFAPPPGRLASCAHGPRCSSSPSRHHACWAAPSTHLASAERPSA